MIMYSLSVSKLDLSSLLYVCFIILCGVLVLIFTGTTGLPIPVKYLPDPYPWTIYPSQPVPVATGRVM